VLFARQDEMIRTVALLRQNREATATLGDALRAALLAAGGVSVDELEAELALAKKELLDNWDLERGGPQNNRGIDNPYKKNVGRLLAAYYQREELRRALRSARLAEILVADTEARLAAEEARKGALIPQKTAMEAVAGEIRQRAILAPRLTALELAEQNLKAVNLKWPQTQMVLETQQSRLQECRGKLAEAELELAASRAAATAGQLRELYRSAKPLDEEVNTLQRERQALPAVETADLKWLDEALAQLTTREAELAAMKLTGRLTVTQPLEISVETGLDRKTTQRVETETELEGEGRLRLGTREWTVEIRAGQGDVEQLMTVILDLRRELARKLEALGVGDAGRARETHARRQELELQMTRLRGRLDGILQGRDFAALAAEVVALPEMPAVRDAETVLAETIRLQGEAEQIESELGRVGRQLEDWEQEFGSYEAVMDRLADTRGEAAQLRQQLSGLAPLPEPYSDAAAFLDELSRLQEEARALDDRIFSLKMELMEAQNSLPSLTSEELDLQLREAAERFARLEQEGAALLLVEEEFRRVRDDIDNKTFTPFTEAFIRYLAPATGHRYRAAALEGALPTAICSTEGKELPLELLSTGTSRGIALALRLAMGEFLLQGAGGFMVMDDPLVDLDPERKAHAAEMVQGYSRGRQLIITTCDPEGAQLLGGHCIDFSRGSAGKADSHG
jgi:DNA repair protein SbcC/Rad50